MLYAAYQSFNNRAALARARVAGCYSCLITFPPGWIVAWTHDDSTALCPRCGVDAVLPDVDDAATLRAAHDRWYQDAADDETRPAVFSPDPE